MADRLQGVPRSPRTPRAEGGGPHSHQSPWPHEPQFGSSERPVYIYKLPYCAYYQLCRYLDADKKWDILAGLMEMDPVDIKLFSNATLRGGSPADEVLKKFGERNGRISQVFRYLFKMQYFKGMHILQEYVDPKYWPLLEAHRTGTDESSAMLSAYMDPPSAPPYESGQMVLKLQSSSRNMNTPGSESLLKGHKSSKLPSPTAAPNGTRSLCPGAFAAAKPPGVVPTTAAAAGVAAAVKNENDRLQEQLLSSGIRVLSVKSHSRPNDPRIVKLHNVNVNAEINFKDIDLEPIKHIPYAELAAATQNFAESNILGKGGFGTVYRGNWKDVTVAVKKLRLSTQPESREHERQAVSPSAHPAPLVPLKVDEKEKKRKAEEEHLRIKSMLTELRVLEKCRFPNILALYGVSVDNAHKPCIVYEFMPGGSLDDRLKRKDSYASMPPLTWHQRASIARGTARGLNYLHTIQENQPLVHGDVKPANILLDGNLQPKLGDFGLTREGPEGECTHRAVSRLQGTKLYLPHEYLQSRHLSTKVDVYSFGLVLLELATNLRLFDDTRTHRFLSAHVHALKIIGRHLDAKDPTGGDEPGSNDLVELFISLGLKCSADKKKYRPEMAEVLEALRDAAVACRSPQPMVTGYSREATTTVQQQLAVAVGSSPPALAVPHNMPRLSPSDNMQVGPSSPVPPTVTTGTANIGVCPFQQPQHSPQTPTHKPQNVQLQPQQLTQEQQRKVHFTQQYLLSLQQAQQLQLQQQQQLYPPAGVNRLPSPIEQNQPPATGTENSNVGSPEQGVLPRNLAAWQENPIQNVSRRSSTNNAPEGAPAGTEPPLPHLPLLYQTDANDLPLVTLLGCSETSEQPPAATISTSSSNINNSTTSTSNSSADISPN